MTDPPDWLIERLSPSRSSTNSSFDNVIIKKGGRNNALTSRCGSAWSRGATKEALLEEAMAVAAKSEYPETDQQIIRILLVHYYLYRDDLQKAEILLNQAKATWGKEQENRKYWEVFVWDELQSQIWAAEARLLVVSGKLDAGEVLYRKALENFREHKDIPNYGEHILIPKLNLRVHLWYLQMLGDNLIRQGRAVEAEIIWREMISESVTGFGRYSNTTADATTGFARALLEQGRFDEAETLADTTLEIWQTIEAPSSSVSLQAVSYTHLRAHETLR